MTSRNDSWWNLPSLTELTVTQNVPRRLIRQQWLQLVSWPAYQKRVLHGDYATAHCWAGGVAASALICCSHFVVSTVGFFFCCCGDHWSWEWTLWCLLPVHDASSFVWLTKVTAVMVRIWSWLFWRELWHLELWWTVFPFLLLYSSSSLLYSSFLACSFLYSFSFPFPVCSLDFSL